MTDFCGAFFVILGRKKPDDGYVYGETFVMHMGLKPDCPNRGPRRFAPVAGHKTFPFEDRDTAEIVANRYRAMFKDQEFIVWQTGTPWPE